MPERPTDMSRWNQTWTCRACGHASYKVVSYPKYGASETPLAVFEKRSRCTKCGVRGSAKITENRAGGRSSDL